MQEIIEFINRHIILSMIWIALVVAILFIIVEELTSKVKAIANAEATHLINREDAIVIDLRQQNDFHKGHIAGSINLSPLEIKNKSISKFKKHHPIIVVDNTGIQAQGPANELIKAGFEKVFILKGGISCWRNENLPLIRSN